MPSGRSKNAFRVAFLVFDYPEWMRNIHFLDNQEKMRYYCYIDYITGAKQNGHKEVI